MTVLAGDRLADADRDDKYLTVLAGDRLADADRDDLRLEEAGLGRQPGGDGLQGSLQHRQSERHAQLALRHQVHGLPAEAHPDEGRAEMRMLRINKQRFMMHL